VPTKPAADKAEKSPVGVDRAAAERDKHAPPAMFSSWPRGESPGYTEEDASAHRTVPAGLPMPTAPRVPQRDDVIRLGPNIISVKHWDRLLAGLLYAVQPHVDWATLLRRSLSVDALQCPKCQGRLRVIAVITEREPARRILAHLGLPTEPPRVARARDPTDDVGDQGQLSLFA
jgi:hypothetical protein